MVAGRIGEDTPFIQERIFEKLDWCGAVLDREQNRNVVEREAPITTAESSIQVWVIPTQEGLMIAQEIADHGLR